MIDSPPIRILDQLAASYNDDAQTPLHEIVRSGLNEIIDEHFVDGQRFWPETAVSERLNVSRMTVRRALNVLSDQGRLSRHRARGTFVRKSGPGRAPAIQGSTAITSVGVFIPYLGSPYWSDVIDEIAVVSAATGRTLHVYAHDREEEAQSAAAQLVTNPLNEAIVLLGNSQHATIELHSTLVQRGFRIVTVDMPIRGFPVPYVGVDNDMGVHMAIQHLTDLGHARIAMLSYEPPQNVNTQLRVNAFASIIEERSLSESFLFRADLTIPGGTPRVIAAAMEQIWEKRPTALFCDSAGGASVALKWLAEKGVEIPRELSLMCFDDALDIRFARPPMSCVAQPLAQMARRVMDLIDRPEAEHILLPPTLIVRDSTSPPRM
ncbi:MAG: LacI family DNA-binding transcriptional regulator [Capsulimonadaceae bacterium]|nr:LacI family DNA-binding transcriptional regulator [Capsulimonadaceae bacterium]